MEALLEVTNYLSAVVFLLMVLASPLLFFWGRKYFAEKGTVWTGKEATHAISEQVEKADHRIRDHFQSVVGNMGVLATQRHEQLTRELRELKDDMRGALRRSNEAHDRANEALAQANRAWDKVEGVEKRLEDQYKMVTGSLERIEKAVQKVNGN